MAKKSTKMLWFSRAGDISRMGPFPTQLRACEGIRGHDGNPVPGAFVWCETETDYKKYQKKAEEKTHSVFTSALPYP